MAAPLSCRLFAEVSFQFSVSSIVLGDSEAAAEERWPAAIDKNKGTISLKKLARVPFTNPGLSLDAYVRILPDCICPPTSQKTARAATDPRLVPLPTIARQANTGLQRCAGGARL